MSSLSFWGWQWVRSTKFEEGLRTIFGSLTSEVASLKSLLGFRIKWVVSNFDAFQAWLLPQNHRNRFFEYPLKRIQALIILCGSIRIPFASVKFFDLWKRSLTTKAFANNVLIGIHCRPFNVAKTRWLSPCKNHVRRNHTWFALVSIIAF